MQPAADEGLEKTAAGWNQKQDLRKCLLTDL